MKQLAFLFVLLASLGLGAQTIEGTITDATTGETLPYVNIGIVGKNIGTVSADNGKFQLHIAENHNPDDLRLSMIGYEPLTVSVSKIREMLSAHPVIKLQPSATPIAEVVVSKKKLKEKVLGNRTQSQSATAGFSSNKLGNEIGIVITIKKSPTYIESFTASVASEQKAPIKLRLNFYNLKDGMPDQLIQNENIIVTTPVVNGLLTVDLSAYNLIAHDDFFVSLEWIENGPGHGVKFSAAFLGSPLIARETSQGTWEKVGFVGIGFTVKVKY